MIRRQIVLGAAAVAVAPALGACTPDSSQVDVARDLRRPVTVDTDDRMALMRELVRCATLAPSSHNTQCWKFRVLESSIAIEPDLLRRCPVVDPDDHHMFVSLGCATENLVHAALAHGLHASVSFNAEGGGAVLASLGATKPSVSSLLQAIATRQCTRGDYDGKPLSLADLHALEQAGRGTGVRMVLLTERSAMEKVLEYVVAANTAQINDSLFIAELKSWIRFSNGEAVRSGDGLFAGSTGNPTMPRWLGSRMMGLFLTPKSENDRYARQIRSSAGIAVFVSDTSDKAHWVEAGRCYERFALQATALGIRNAFLNQPVEVGTVRLQFADALGLGNLRPDLVVRFGRGPTLPWSMRRPVDTVMV